jgi:structural maintenance of chromosome 4
VQAAAAEVAKELAAQERREIGLQEKRKHAVGRAKKLKKSVQEVIFPLFSLFVSD